MNTFQSANERNEAIVKEMKERAKKGFGYGEKSAFINEIAEKYKISMANAQLLYYTKVRGKENEETEIQELKKEPEMGATTKTIIPLNFQDVRVVEYKGTTCVVAKDLLLSVGIKSSSNYLNDLLTEEERIITSLPTSHGFAKTLIISLDIAIDFLESVATQHTNIKIRSNANRAIPELKKFQLNYFEKKPSIQQLNEDKIYHEGENIKVRILQIGEKTVETETTDEAKTKGIIYIADVADTYVSNLHAFFSEGEVIEATVKRYDDRIKRLSLSTWNNPIIKLKSKYRTTTQVVQTPIQEVGNVPPPLPELHFDTANEIKQEEVVTTPMEQPIERVVIQAPQHEVDRMMEYMQKEVRLPFISDEAKAKLNQLLQSSSLFEVSVAMVKLSTDFNPDVSLLFMEQLERNLNKEH